MQSAKKIVVLDGFTLNPGDLTWNGLQSLGECSIYDRTAPDLVLERAAKSGIILTNKTVLDRPVIEMLPDMKYIGVMATGYNVVDLDAARERGIPVTNVPKYGTQSVAQMVFALLLEMTQQVAHHAQTVRNGHWSKNPDFCYWDYPLIELDGLTLGIIGFGSIGQTVAKIAQAFGMKVLAYDINQIQTGYPAINFTDMNTIFRDSDVVSLHCPLTAESEGLINTYRLSLMKKTAYLINTGRGPLVNESDLANALNSGKIAGAALDVLQVEPPPPDNPLLSAKNCFITPHIAWATRASRSRLLNIVVDNIRAYLVGEYKNVVNGV
ncbi:MAG: D-2-hydroxyacid dehydrogenase [Candidatus Latescibacteria bacterium]|nr:D-2-hydroxyacid dehydrogenase [Candidatus Latescibacterota bacterium]